MNLDADPYRTLGLTRGASLDEVKRAYRRLAKANHPDAAGATALPRFLAIHAAYKQIVGGSAPGATGSSAARRRPTSADAERADATRRAYGGRPREPRAGPAQTDGPRAQARGSTSGTPGARQGGARPGRASPGSSARPAQGGRQGDPSGHANAGAAGAAGAGTSAGDAGTAGAAGGTTEANPARGKATLGSTSYDGADAGPFEPDWGGASWYGTTSGTYWTINPKEYADPRKHGPEYQARARRAAATPGAARAEAGQSGSPTHTTSSWWDSTSGPEAEDEPVSAGGGGTHPVHSTPTEARTPQTRPLRRASRGRPT